MEDDIATVPADRRLTRRQAEALTNRIRQATEHLWLLVHQAHEARVWEAYGYGSWTEYVAAELPITRSSSYRLLAQAETILAIEAVSRARDTISQRDAEVLKRSKGAVERVVEAVNDGEPVRDVVAREVKKGRVAEPARGVVSRARDEPEPPPVPAVAHTRDDVDRALALLDPLTEHVLANRRNPELLKRVGRRLVLAAALAESAAVATPAHTNDAAVVGCRHPMNRRVGGKCLDCGLPAPSFGVPKQRR